jgi:hypothetical protein
MSIPIILKDTGLAVAGHSNYADFQSGMTEVLFEAGITSMPGL